jgi:hypothetical protein
MGHVYVKTARADRGQMYIVETQVKRARDGGGGAEGPGKDGVAITASVNDMRRSEKTKVLEKV